jgi:hypothetical protein
MNEERAKKILSKFIDHGNILHYGNKYEDHIFWYPGDDRVDIEGEFTLEEIEALAWWMRNK